MSRSKYRAAISAKELVPKMIKSGISTSLIDGSRCIEQDVFPMSIHRLTRVLRTDVAIKPPISEVFAHMQNI